MKLKKLDQIRLKKNIEINIVVATASLLLTHRLRVTTKCTFKNRIGKALTRGVKQLGLQLTHTVFPFVPQVAKQRVTLFGSLPLLQMYLTIYTLAIT